MSNNKKRKNEKEKITTIKLLEETKQRIEKLREHKRESYDDIIKKILYVLNATREEPEKGKRILERISELRKRWQEEEEQQQKSKKEELKRT
jgi:hypothetical protein